MLEEVREVTGSPVLARGPGPHMPQEGTCSDLGGLPESGGIGVDGFGQNRFLGICSWLRALFLVLPFSWKFLASHTRVPSRSYVPSFHSGLNAERPS